MINYFNKEYFSSKYWFLHPPSSNAMMELLKGNSVCGTISTKLILEKFSREPLGKGRLKKMTKNDMGKKRKRNIIITNEEQNAMN